MRKTNTPERRKQYAGGNQDRDLHLSCVGADRVVASHWLAGFIQPEKRSYGETWLSASGIHLSGWLYFHI